MGKLIIDIRSLIGISSGKKKTGAGSLILKGLKIFWLT